jgi:hypothetical protein
MDLRDEKKYPFIASIRAAARARRAMNNTASGEMSDRLCPRCNVRLHYHRCCGGNVFIKCRECGYKELAND